MANTRSRSRNTAKQRSQQIRSSNRKRKADTRSGKIKLSIASSSKKKASKVRRKNSLSSMDSNDEKTRYMLAKGLPDSMSNVSDRTSSFSKKKTKTTELWYKRPTAKPVPRIPISSPFSRPVRSRSLSLHDNKLEVGKRITRSSPRKDSNITCLNELKTQTTPFRSQSPSGKEVEIPPDNKKSSAKSQQRLSLSSDPERRLSIRQTECLYRYTDIIVKKSSGFTQVILHASSANQKNCLTVKALQELSAVLNNAKYDDSSKLLLLTGSNNGTFCSGLDLTYLTTGDIQHKATIMSDSLRDLSTIFLLKMDDDPLPISAVSESGLIGLERVMTWDIDALKDFCRRRGYKVSGTKVELCSKVYVLYNNETPELPGSRETEISKRQDYRFIHNAVTPTCGPNRLKKWINQRKGVKEWPPVSYIDIVQFVSKHSHLFSSDALNNTCTYRPASLLSFSEFMRAVLAFTKPLVAAVNGQAVGCGVAVLPLCDIVYASDKATFFTPYAQLGQIPEAGLTCTLSQIIGIALANEMLMAGRMLTALEAYQMGLVSQVFWPTSLMQEVIPRIYNMSSCSGSALNSTKSLIKSQNRERLLSACHLESAMLSEMWPTIECQTSIKHFLDHCDIII